MADDDWQLQAIHKQFDVFENLFEPCSSYAATDLREIIKKVDTVISQQLTMKSDKTKVQSRQISTALIRALPHEENNIFISYVVVVTNEVIDGDLCKFPVFRVLIGDQHTFVDIYGSVYKSWDNFLKSNDMPARKFCYPVNGCYDVRGKLKVDFFLSPAFHRSKKYIWYFLGGVVICGAVVAATFFFEISPIAYPYIQRLIAFAEGWAPQIISGAMIHMSEFVKLGQRYRTGGIDISTLILAASSVLSKIYATFKDEIDLIWEETKKAMIAAYNYLYKMFQKYFKEASNRSKHQFFANLVRLEEEMSQTEEEAYAQLSEMKRSLTSIESPISTSGTVMVYDLSYNQKIFQSCRSDSSLVCEIKDRNNKQDKLQTFKPTTESLLTLSQTVAKQLGAKTLSDVKDIFESLSCIVKDEYKNKIDNYIKGVFAAKAAARHEMDLDVYNNSLGIVGDPKDHFMKEAMESTHGSRLAYRLKEKIKEFKMDSKILLIPIYKMSEDDDVGVYKSIGVRGRGKISAQWLLTVLKESLSDLDESTLVVNETDSVIYIRSDDISIFALQEVNEENTSEGIVYVNKLI